MFFLINNPLILLGGIVVIGFMIFMGIKITREIKLNKLLQTKQQAMRVVGTSRHFTKRLGLLTSTALAPAFVLALVLSIGVNNTIIPTGNLQDIRDGNDVIDIYEEFQDNMSGYRYKGWFAVEESVDLEMDFGDSPTADDGSNDGDQGSDEYSKTNNQVQGVDEMDNVVTDGKYIYSVQYNQVFITLSYTQSQGAAALSNTTVIDYIDDETECPSGMYVTGLYVDEEYLVVIGSEYEYYCEAKEGDDSELFYYDYWYGYNNNVSVYVYDKNNDFELLSEYNLAGNLIGTRKIGDNIYVITNTYMPLYNEDINVDDYVPYYSINAEETNASYRDVVYVEGTNPNSFTSFYAIDIDNEAVDMEVLLGDSGYNLYVSPTNIYLVGNIYYFTPMAGLLDVEEPISETKTAIQKIAINDGDVEYVTTGTVTGYTLNQFSMDENNNYLRIATTTGWWGDSINNRVFILNEDLEEVSRLENLGKPGETIRSVRFVGDYGYIVTFEQTDPFYVINLSDPENPFTEGELEIPGFSTYLQPLNDDYMLGIGFGDNSGGTNGLKISVYDISDKTNPTVFDEIIFDYEEFGWGSSSATYNHKDLLIDMGKGIIALPFSTYEWNQTNGYTYNSGILVYDFDEINGLTESGYITHDTNTDEEVYVYKIKFIDQYFYTVSNKYIKASLISDPETILHSVTLPEYQYNSEVTED